VSLHKPCGKIFFRYFIQLSHFFCIFVPIKVDCMIDEQKVLLHSAEMAEHANGTAQYLGACQNEYSQSN